MLLQNRLLQDRFEQLAGGKEHVSSLLQQSSSASNPAQSKNDEDGESSLNSTALDELYDQFKVEKAKKKKKAAGAAVQTRVTTQFGKPRVISNARETKSVR